MTKQFIIDMVQTSLFMSVFILAAVILSPLFSKRYMTKMKYWIWLVIAFRLIVPFQFSFSQNSAPVNIPVNDFTVVELAWPQTQPLSNAEPQAIADTPDSDSVTNPVVNDVVNNNTTEQYTSESVQQTNTSQSAAQSQIATTYSLSAIEIAAIVWLAGLSVYFICQFVAMLRFRGLLKKAKWLSVGSYVYDTVQNIKLDMGIRRKIHVLVWEQAPSPFLTGLINRKLVLPASKYCDSELELAIRHELTHSKRHDLWYKAFLNIANGLHWFNPIVYVMKKQAARDVEMICDETLIADKDIALKKAYGELILQNVEQRCAKYPALCTHMSADKKTLKKRIKNIMETRVRRKGISVILCVLLGLVSVGNLVACNAFGEDLESKDGISTFVFNDVNSLSYDNHIYQIGEWVYLANNEQIYRFKSDNSKSDVDSKIVFISDADLGLWRGCGVDNLMQCGQYLVYSQSSYIYKINLTTSEQKILFSAENENTCFIFEVKDNCLYFSGTEGDFTDGIYKIDINGGQPEQVVNFGDNGLINCIQISNDRIFYSFYLYGLYPDFLYSVALDGTDKKTVMAYTSKDFIVSGEYLYVIGDDNALYKADINGENIIKLVELCYKFIIRDDYIIYNEIRFSSGSKVSSHGKGILIMRTDGTEFTSVYDGLAEVRGSSGSYIFFSSLGGPDYLLSTDGTGVGEPIKVIYN